MRNLLFALALLLPVAAVAAPPPKPFSAEYEVFQNDKKLGTGTITLRSSRRTPAAANRPSVAWLVVASS